MKAYFNICLSLLIYSTLSGCVSEKGTLDHPQTAFENFIIKGMAIPDQPDTNFNIFIKSTTGGTCSGSLVSPKFILTAAHCLKGSETSEISVTAKSEVKTGQDFTSNLPPIKALHIHPKSNGSSNDIGLIELSRNVSSSLVPVSLYKGPIPQDEIFAVYVYGYSKYSSTQSGNLLGYFRSEEPMNIPGNEDASGTRKLQGKLLAANLPAEQEHIQLLQFNGGICTGDSGGPVIVNINGKKTQIGINTGVPKSYGVPNCSVVGYITSVPKHYDWIAEIINPGLEKGESASPELLTETKTPDQICAALEALVFETLMSYGKKIHDYTCDQELIEGLESILPETKVNCSSEMTGNYPLSLENTIAKLKEDC